MTPRGASSTSPCRTMLKANDAHFPMVCAGVALLWAAGCGSGNTPSAGGSSPVTGGNSIAGNNIAPSTPNAAPAGPIQVKAELPAVNAKTSGALRLDLNLSAIEAQAKSFDDIALDRFATLARTASGTEIPPARRWEFFLPEGITVADYAEQMDALGMELAVLMDSGQVEYVTKLFQPMPTRRQGPLVAEKRPYWSWQRGDLLTADREILARTGLETGDRIVLHFWPAATEVKLVQLEAAFQNRAAAAVYRTRFGIRPAANTFEFFVMEQIAR